MAKQRKRSKGSAGRSVETRLREMVECFEQILEISPTAIVFTDLGNRIAAWNPSAERLFGYTAEEAAGRDLDDLVASTDTLHAEAAEFRQRIAASEHVQTISRRTCKDGSIVDVQLSAAPLVMNGESVGTFAIYHDITELNRQRRFLESFLEMSPEAIVTYEHDVVTSWNPAAERLFGYSAEEAVGRNADELVVKGRPDLYVSLDAPTAHFVTQRTRKHGSLVDVDVVGGPITVGGEIVATQAFYHDVTELQEQKRYFESLLEVSPEAIITTDLDDVVTSWNPAAERLFGYASEEAVGRDLDDLVATRPELQKEAKYLSASSMEAGSIHRVTQQTRKDGSLVDVDIVGGPVTLGGKPVAKHAIYHDITELQEQKRYFESLLEVSPTAIVITDLESMVVSWNPAAEKLFGYSAEEALGRRTDDLVATRADLHDEAAGYTEALARGERIQAVTQRTRRDGSLVDVELLVAPVIVRGKPERMYVMYHDIGEIQEQKRYFESLLEINPSAIVVTDLDAKVVSWNPGAVRLFGYSADEAIGKDLDELVASDPDLHREALGYSERAMQGERLQDPDERRPQAARRRARRERDRGRDLALVEDGRTTYRPRARYPRRDRSCRRYLDGARGGPHRLGDAPAHSRRRAERAIATRRGRIGRIRVDGGDPRDRGGDPR